MLRIEETDLSRVPSEVMGLTRPGAGSVMKRWVSEARSDDAEGLAWLAWEGDRLVGWAAVVDGELSVYIRPSERRRGIGSRLIGAIGEVGSLSAHPHNRIGERFFRKNGVLF